MTGSDGIDLTKAVLPAEIWNPDTETWTEVASLHIGREYHSTALLLADGRVWVAGTDGETRMEVYTPDSLLRGVRPVITDAPASLAYGEGFSVSLLEPTDISSVCFIRLSAVTHAFNMGQRHVALDFSRSDAQSIAITAPDDPNLAPPGHYMLFVLDSVGVPSVAATIQLVYV